MQGSIIYLEDVTVSFDGFKALQRLNFYMDYPELRVVIGPNGAGKTTLLDVISGRVRPAEGRVIFGMNTDITRLREHEIVRLGVGRKFQTPSVFNHLTVFENLELSLYQPKRGVFATLLSPLSSRQLQSIETVLDITGLASKAHVPAGVLAHGEKQWLEIGMVLLQEPKLLLIDEPVAGMTDQETAHTAKLLERIAEDHSVLVIEHDMAFVRQIARKITVLHEGQVLCEGPVEVVQNDPRVVEIYLGRKRNDNSTGR